MKEAYDLFLESGCNT